VGFGGINRSVAEGRLLYLVPAKFPLFFGLEGFFERNAELGYGGVGPDPASDPRNHFSPTTTGRVGLYAQTRARLIGSAAVRLGENVELLGSASQQIRYLDDAPDAGANALSKVFVPGSVDGANARSRRLYSEIALRFDNRESRSAPVPGALFETYGGISQSTDDRDNQHLAYGARIAGYLRVYRSTNILTPRLGIDAIAPLGGRIGFTELRSERDFRGGDSRVDRHAAIASLDYRWAVSGAFAARLFTDATTVAPRFAALRPNQAVFAFGIGLDLYTPTTEIGRLALAIDSHAAAHVLLSFGVAPRGFGDRQHR
jgi:hypothetical protein